MPNPKPDPRKSEGARTERRSFRSHLVRLINKSDKAGTFGQTATYRRLLTWVLAREQRYSRRPGGL